MATCLLHHWKMKNDSTLICPLQLISGQYVCPHNNSASPLVEIELIGIPADCAKHKSKMIQRNALNPIWNEVYHFQVRKLIVFTRWDWDCNCFITTNRLFMT